MSKRPWLWIVVITAVVLLLAPLASRLPDGLERVAADLGFEGRAAIVPAQEHAPMPDYSIPSLPSSYAGLSTVLAGLFGAMAVFLALKGVETLLRSKGPAGRPHRRDSRDDVRFPQGPRQGLRQP